MHCLSGIHVMYLKMAVHTKHLMLDVDSVNTQCVLISDGSAVYGYDSYAVFIYECGGMTLNGATIGWQGLESYEYRVHELSGANSAQVGCRYSSTHGAIVYKLSDESKSAIIIYRHYSFKSDIGMHHVVIK